MGWKNVKSYDIIPFLGKVYYFSGKKI